MKYIKSVRSEAFQRVPNWYFWYANMTSGNPANRRQGVTTFDHQNSIGSFGITLESLQGVFHPKSKSGSAKFPIMPFYPLVFPRLRKRKLSYVVAWRHFIAPSPRM
jgi:hypothetical protein